MKPSNMEGKRAFEKSERSARPHCRKGRDESVLARSSFSSRHLFDASGRPRVAVNTMSQKQLDRLEEEAQRLERELEMLKKAKTMKEACEE